MVNFICCQAQIGWSAISGKIQKDWQALRPTIPPLKSNGNIKTSSHRVLISQLGPNRNWVVHFYALYLTWACVV